MFDFLDLLYGDAPGYTTVSAKRADGIFEIRSFSLDQRAEIEQFIADHQHCDVYIKRASQFTPPVRGSGRAGLAYLQRVITVDLDYGAEGHKLSTLPPTKEDALRLLEESGLPEPTLIVHTGNGLMPIWALREPLPVSEVEPLQRGVEAQIRLTALRYGWTLDNTSDAARSIRVVGTYNWKQRPVRKPVAVLRRSDRYYDASDFARWARRPLIAPRRAAGEATKETVQALLKHIPGDGLEYNKWLAAIWTVQTLLPENEAAEVLDAWTYDWEKHQKPDDAEGNIGTLINLARENGYEGVIPGIRGGYITSPELPAHPAVFKLNQRFLDFEIEPTDAYPNVIVLKSPKGTGKTEFLSRVAECYGRVLNVGHRISLVRQAAKRLNLTAYYDNGVWITNAPRVATTIHSLDKIETKEPYELVIIDEIEQVLKALVTDRNLKNGKVHAVGALMEHLKRAKLVILADADIGEATLTFIERVFGDGTYIAYVENEYQHRMLDYLVLNPTPEDVMQKALDWYNAGECKIAFACNTRADADKAELFFAENAPGARILKITSETGGDNNELLENINERLADVDIFVYSPSVGTGVSIDVEGFALFGIARNGVGVGDVDDFRQQLGRIRKPYEREANVYIDPKQMSEPTAPEAYRDLAQLRALEADFRVTRRNGEPEPQSDWDSLYLDLYCVVRAKSAAQKNRFFDNIVGAYAAEGVEVCDDRKERRLSDEERRAIAVRLKEQRAAKEQERAERIADAPTPEEAQTKEEKADAQRKVELEDKYGITVDAELVLDDEKGAYRQAQRFASVENSDVAGYLDDIESARRFRADRNYFSLFAFWFTTLLTALRLKIEEGAEIAITEEFLDLVERNAAVIQAALGVKVRSDFRKRPMTFVGALLDQIGVGIEGKQVRHDGKRARIYRLVNVDRASLRATGVRRRYEEQVSSANDAVAFLGVQVSGEKRKKRSVTTLYNNNRKASVVTA